MKTILLYCRMAPIVPLLFLGACASKPAKPSAAGPITTAEPSAQPRPARPSLDDILQQSAGKPSLPFEGEGWQQMFNGKTLAGWRETDFAGRGEIQCQFRMIILNTGDPFTGINWTNELPKMNYEVALDAMRVTGSDFFCGMTVPVGDSFCTLIVGGWGGSLVGISSLDG